MIGIPESPLPPTGGFKEEFRAETSWSPVAVPAKGIETSRTAKILRHQFGRTVFIPTDFYRQQNKHSHISRVLSTFVELRGVAPARPDHLNVLKITNIPQVAQAEAATLN
jgi:hypothetical protein